MHSRLVCRRGAAAPHPHPYYLKRNVCRFFAVTVVTVLALTFGQPIQQDEAVGIYIKAWLRYASRLNSSIT